MYGSGRRIVHIKEQAMRPLFVILFLHMAAAIPALAQGGPPGVRAVSVESVEVRATEIRSSVKAVGTLLAEASATLRSEIPGQVIEIHFEEGQRISGGDKLFSLEDTVLKAEVNEARANAERSEAAYKRAQEMYAKKLISATEYDTARADHNVDLARLLSSRAVLSKTTIKAPFDGFAGLRQINVGDYATVGQELVDVVQLDPLRVDFSVPETLLSKVKPGLTVEVTADAYPNEIFEGEITAVAPKSDVQGHSIEVRANLPNGELKLRPGLFVNVNVFLGARLDAIVIPEQAIWPIGQQKTVYVIIDGKAERRDVTLGERQPGSVEILAGLEIGDVVVTAGQLKLYDGADVRSTSSNSSVLH